MTTQQGFQVQQIKYENIITSFQPQQVKQGDGLTAYLPNIKTVPTTQAQEIKHENMFTNQQNIMAVPIIYNEQAFQNMKNNQKFPPNQLNTIPNTGQKLYMIKQETGMVPLFTPVGQMS